MNHNILINKGIDQVTGEIAERGERGLFDANSE